MGVAGTTVPPRICSKVEISCSISKSRNSSPSPKKNLNHEGNPFMKVRLQGSWQQRWPSDVLRTIEMQLNLLQAHEEEHEVSIKDLKRKNYDEEASTQVQTNGHIKLPSKPALPYQWEQFLDLRTGEVYYIDWSSCKRTSKDPRKLFQQANDQIENRMKGAFELPAAKRIFAIKQQPPSISESNNPRRSSNQSLDGDSSPVLKESVHINKVDDNIMVAMGCCQCLMYFMLPKLSPNCPSCGQVLQLST